MAFGPNDIQAPTQEEAAAITAIGLAVNAAISSQPFRYLQFRCDPAQPPAQRVREEVARQYRAAGWNARWGEDATAWILVLTTEELAA